ncbi:Hypothetical protein GLP15_3877 [Giardia lamblia P15]|uniref:P/Homo B domain-containing protein n=1 Tax=Giardia intestinalis (strain P15) TaxID=658858 RepID=E1F197_GIAIA|nr:Hypothetical protein GLP15_3877 [Giardia lamblia P15]
MLLLLLLAISILATSERGELCLLELREGYQLDSTTLDPNFVRDLGVLDLKVFDCYHEIADELQAHPELEKSLKEQYLQHLRSQAAVSEVYCDDFFNVTALLYHINDQTESIDPLAHLHLINIFRSDNLTLIHPDVTGRRIKLSFLNSGISRTCTQITLNEEYSINCGGFNASLFTEDAPGTIALTLAAAHMSESTSGVARNAQVVERTVFSPKLVDSDASSGMIASSEYEASFINVLEGYSIKGVSSRFMNLLACMYEIPFAAHLRNRDSLLESLVSLLKNVMAAVDVKDSCNGDFIPIFSTGVGEENVNLLNYLQSSVAVYVQSVIQQSHGGANTALTVTYPGSRIGANILFSSPSGTKDEPLLALGFDDVAAPVAYGPGSALSVGAAALALVADAFAALGYQMSFSDLLNVIAETGRHTEPGLNSSYLGGASEWKRNAAGYLFSNTYGFGLVDVNASLSYVKALRHIYGSEGDYMSRQAWGERCGNSCKEFLGCTGVIIGDGEECGEKCGVHRIAIGRYIPDRITLQKKLSVVQNRRVEKIGLRVVASDGSNLKELSILVQSPEGTRGTIIQPDSVTTEDVGAVLFYSYLFYGENSAGDWIISVLDVGYHQSIFIEYIDIVIFGIESHLTIAWPSSITLRTNSEENAETVMEKMLRTFGYKRRTVSSSNTLYYTCTEHAVTKKYALFYLSGTQTAWRSAPQTPVTIATGIQFSCTGPKVNGKEFSLALTELVEREAFSGQGRLLFVPSGVTELDRTTLREDVFVSNSIRVAYSPEEDEGLPNEEGGVSSEARHRPRLLAAIVTSLCVLAAAFLGGAFRE